MTGGTRTWPVWLLALVLGGLAWMFGSRHTKPSGAPAPPAGERPQPPTEATQGPTSTPPEAPAPPPSPAPGASCPSHAEQRCMDGDVWWLDGCGEREEKADECELAACREAHCQRPDPLGCDEPPTGRCVGDQVRSCFGGQLHRIDCARLGLHCVLGAEGAECRPEPDPSLNAPTCLGDDSRCESDRWVRCVGGRELTTDCRDVGGTCLDRDDGQGAGCALTALPLSLNPQRRDCDACGCPYDPDIEERCNGRDDDGDGLIDQDVDCGPIPLVAYVVGAPGRFGSYEASDIEREVARVNELLRARDDGVAPLQVELADLVWLDHPEWLELAEEVLDRLAQAPELHPPGDDFAIPVLFTDEVIVGEVPKPGASTLPNGSCGGRQKQRGPDVGLIAVSKARASTTVAHEIGHFLGLCHTHEQDQVAGVHVATDEDGSLQVCEAPCRGEGDGICDTPVDPGALRCPYNSQCQVFCPGPEAPDVTNLMGYYTDCRFRFTAEQLARMRHTLALRRAWQPCLGGACTCTPGRASCPPEMGCRAARDGERIVHVCALEGPVPAGGPCDSSLDCGADAQCIASDGGARCVRVCGETATACHCVQPGGMALAVCGDDLP